MSTLRISFSTLILINILVACNFAPDNYVQGKEKYNQKKFEEAINFFKLTPTENKEWKDSSDIMIAKSVEATFGSNDLSIIQHLCQVFQYDSLVKPYLLSTTKVYWSKQLTKEPDFCFNLFDSLRFMLPNVTGVDTLIRKTEDAFFKGVWKSISKSIKNHEIYFERDSESHLLQAKSNKNIDGWNLGKTIYKDIFYLGNNKFDHKVRVFSTRTNYDYYYGYYSDPYEYFTKTKGSMKILAKDSLLIDYEGSVSSGNKVCFVRNK
jgi:hypothetical protein